MTYIEFNFELELDFTLSSCIVILHWHDSN